MKVYKLFLFFLLFFIASCAEEDFSETNPYIILIPGSEYTQNGAYIPIGGEIKFRVSAIGDGATITYFSVKRITNTEEITEIDQGMYIQKGGLDTIVKFFKGEAEWELWKFTIMNSHRDTASAFATIYKGEGSAYGPIDHFSSVIIGYQENTELPHYVDLNTGIVYDVTNIAGNESLIDLVSYYYLSSGTSSPTFSCPSYETARTFYPEMNSWSVKNSTLYDYQTTDNDLVSISEFDNAENDSILVSSYIPSSTSGTCKFCYTDKIIPFKTNQGKYGLIKVVRADEFNTGSIEIEIKIQK